jgi:hypothetical protein
MVFSEPRSSFRRRDAPEAVLVRARRSRMPGQARPQNFGTGLGRWPRRSNRNDCYFWDRALPRLGPDMSQVRQRHATRSRPRNY